MFNFLKNLFWSSKINLDKEFNLLKERNNKTKELKNDLEKINNRIIETKKIEYQYFETEKILKMDKIDNKTKNAAEKILSLYRGQLIFIELQKYYLILKYKSNLNNNDALWLKTYEKAELLFKVNIDDAMEIYYHLYDTMNQQ